MGTRSGPILMLNPINCRFFFYQLHSPLSDDEMISVCCCYNLQEIFSSVLKDTQMKYPRRYSTALKLVKSGSDQKQLNEVNRV